MEQLSLFEKNVLLATDDEGQTSKIYGHFAKSVGLTDEDLDMKVIAGTCGPTSFWKRKIRFIQQTLKRKGLVERGKNVGDWNVTEKGKSHLTKAPQNSLRAYFVTKHGIAFHGDAGELPGLFDGEVELIVTSPPYLLTKEREYGNIGKDESSYVSNILKFAEGWMKMLTPTGSIVINIGDSYKPNAGHQSLHKERLLIALEDKLGLHLVQSFSYWSYCRMPTGHYVTKERKHCVNATEAFYWLSPDPKASKASNKKVLVEYSEKQKKMINSAIKRKPAVATRPSGQTIHEETFYKDMGGSIPHNVLIAAPEGSNSEYSRRCRAHNLPRHPAMFPVDLPKFFINYLTDRDDLVVDSFFGSGTTGLAAEQLGRYWVGSEMIEEYLMGARHRFEVL